MGRKGEKTMDGNKISVIIADDNKEFCSILNDYLLNQSEALIYILLYMQMVTEI